MKAIAQKSLSSIVLAVSLALSAGVATTSLAADAPKVSVSKASVKAITDGQKAITAKKYEEAIAKLNEVDSIAARTPYDIFAAAQLRAFAMTQLGKQADAVPFYITQVESGFLPPEEVVRLSRGVTQLLYVSKDFPKTIEWGNKTVAAGHGDADTWFFIAHSHYLQKDYSSALKIVNDYLADAQKRGETPKENPLLVMLQSASHARDTASTLRALELLVQNYAKPDYWRDLVALFRDTNARGANSDNFGFNVYRLMRETGTLRESIDFLEMAQLAISQGSPGEASDAIRRGLAANAFTTESDKSAAAKLQQSAKVLEETDRAGLAKFEAEAKGAKGGEGDVRLGQALLSYDQADKAVEALQRGIGKGSLRNPDEAQMLLGIALRRLDRKAEAATAFGGVKATEGRVATLARYWSFFARS
ncbi:MAG: hypothetical protein RLZZ200_1241 [Pseudomonadota bacterium]